MTRPAPLSPANRLAIELDCARQILRFAQLSDDGDHDALAAMFTTNGRFSRPSTPDVVIQGRDALLSFFRDRPARRTRHLVSNILVDVVEPARAVARSHVLLFTGPVDAPVTSIRATMLGDCRNVLIRQGADWLFAERRGTLALES